MGLDVSLVDGFGLEFPLDDGVRLAESLLEIASFELDKAGDVALHAGVLAANEALRNLPGGQVVVEQRSVGFHGVDRGQHNRERLVVDLDQLKRLFGDVRAGGGHGGDGMALVEHLVAGEQILAPHAVIALRLAEVDGVALEDREIAADDDRFHARQRFGFGGVD